MVKKWSFPGGCVRLYVKGYLIDLKQLIIFLLNALLTMIIR